MIVTQAIRNLVSNKLRLFLTSLAVVLGVGFVCGAFVLGDTINASFDQVFSSANSKAAVDVRGEKVVSDFDRKPVPKDLVATIEGVDGVESAVGVVIGIAQVVDKKGKAVGGQGPPTLGFNWVDSPANPVTLQTGQPPRADDEVVIDSVAAEKAQLKVGDTVTIVTNVGPAKYRISGIGKYGATGQTAGATLTFFPEKVAERVLGDFKGYASVSVVAEPGVADTTLAKRVQEVLPDGYEAVTAAQSAEEQGKAFEEFVNIFRTVLLVFAGISLFVGAFIIFNAFQITIAQRGRQIGLLRAVGASSGQVVGSVLLEALLVAVIASLVGILFGIVVAAGLKAAFNAAGASLPDQSLVVEPRSLIVAFVVGLVVTIGAAVIPAIHSSRVPPIAAIQAVRVERRSRLRVVFAVVMAAVGVVLVLLGTIGDLEGSVRGAVLALGAMLLFFGAAALTQYVARPLASIIGRPAAAWRGMPAQLGRQNAMRNPHRTAQTAAALTIGVALVTGVTIFAASLEKTFVGTVDERVTADVIAFSQSGGFSPSAEKTIASLPEVGASTGWRNGQFKAVDGEAKNLYGIDPATTEQMYVPGVISGSFADLAGPRALAVHKDFAKTHRLSVGSTTPMTFSLTGTAPWKVVAVFSDNSFGEFFVSTAAMEQNVAVQTDQVLLAKAAPGVSPEKAKDAVAKALASYPNITAYTREGYKEFVGTQVNGILRLFYLLLAMAVLIAVFGIVLTLALSVFERTREIGLLRAVGLSRRGTRSMIRWEAVIVSIIGALVGLVVGTFLGITGVKAFPDLTALAVPWVSMIVFVIVAALLGVLAAVLPARRAGRLNVLEAIATE